jgi:hypothetical protein
VSTELEDWLRETLAEDELFRVYADAPGPYTHAVSYMEEVAHERDDLVRRSAAALAGLAGVASVNTDEGEEVVLVEAPSLSAADLSSWLREWWSRAIADPAPWEEPLRQLAATLAGVLEPHGYGEVEDEPSGVTFRAQVGAGMLHAIHVRRSTWNSDLLVVTSDAEVRLERPGRPGGDVAIHVPERDLRSPAEHGWRVPEEVPRLAAFVRDRQLPALDGLRSAEDLLADGRARRGTRALLLADRGDAEPARRLLQEEFDAGPPRYRPGVVALAAELGLAPLETGRDPSLSWADEAFLARWSGEEPLRVAELRRLAGDLDGSRESLDALWRWLPGGLAEARAAGDGGGRPIATAYHGVVSGTATYHRYVATADGSPALRWLAELVVTYLGFVLRQQRPGLRWEIAPDGELVLVGLPYGPVPILRKTWEALAEALESPAAEREEVDLDGLLADISGGEPDEGLRQAIASLMGVDEGGNRLASLVELWLTREGG